MRNINEECGVFGIYNKDGYDTARVVYHALYALQHRGQESCGIAVNDDDNITCIKDLGLVSEVFNESLLSSLKGAIALGHVRYSTTGSNTRENAQPLATRYVKGSLTIVHNGNVYNAAELRDSLASEGAVFRSTNDSEVIAFLIAKERLKTPSVEKAVLNVIPKLKGSFSLLVMSPRKLIAVRDPLGIRPLCIGNMDNDTTVFASETAALDSIGAKFLRDVLPGELVCVDTEKMYSIQDKVTVPISKNNDQCNSCLKKPGALCVFEHIYFARPDSVIDGQSVYNSRITAGRILAQESDVDADMVMGVPDSGLIAAIGYSRQSNIPYGTGLIKNRYIGRTFIQPTQTEREKSVRIKLNALQSAVNGKRIILIDDSIVRGTTIKNLIDLLKSAGATEVHIRISSPKFMHPCFFGTDIPSEKELICQKYSTDELCKIIGADSLMFFPLSRLNEIVSDCQLGFCDACFSGNYPLDVPREIDKNLFE
ncbi:MAG: amidophosphoribosyltransferase [Clostridiales bacterium]|nr:MAG: amidophosphoribosyltransferase [Clostridiales bacterium]